MISRSLVRAYRNPVIVKDGLSRMRSWRAPAVIALYVGTLGLFGCLIFAAQLSTPRTGWGYATIGSSVFTTLALVQLLLVCLFTPAVAAGAISGERERQTLDVLIVSGMTPLRIVWGKLIASVAFMLLLLVAALPLFATVFLFGGVDGAQFAISQLITITTALAIGAVTLFLSTLFRRTLIATVIAYGLAFSCTVGTWVIGIVLAMVAASRQPFGPAPGTPTPSRLLLINPIEAIVSAIYPSAAAPLASPAMPVFSLVPGLAILRGPMVAPWQATVLVELALVVVSVAGAVQLLRGRPPAPPQWLVGRAVSDDDLSDARLLDGHNRTEGRTPLPGSDVTPSVRFRPQVRRDVSPGPTSPGGSTDDADTGSG